MGGSKKHKQNGAMRQEEAKNQLIEMNTKASEKRIVDFTQVLLDAIEKGTLEKKWEGNLTTPEAVRSLLVVANNFNNVQLKFQRKEEIQIKKGE